VADGVGLEFWATRDVIGPREVCVRRIASSAVRQVEREDGAIWVDVESANLCGGCCREIATPIPR
jgi:hypothetical protein